MSLLRVYQQPIRITCIRVGNLYHHGGPTVRRVKYEDGPALGLQLDHGHRTHDGPPTNDDEPQCTELACLNHFDFVP
ncbi:hypothetical protein JTE90_014304 [Oedothorax gibbosus]|uniref:Uncharacterized protein n=1 Tax=Oedothorax gibbosus TaxID=931172 RepID=A0AAV6UUT6_9ARAC|nr:hypothetical protein JTE90_014304 [Oedothorax gibbosus]